MRWIIALIMMLACSAAQAEVYQWTDGKGVVHFTDNMDNVPSRYRDKVKKMGPSTQGEEAKPSRQETAPVAAPLPSRRTEAYGGHDERWWRTSLANARREVTTAHEQLAAKKDSLAALRHKRVVFQKPSDRVAYNALSEEISRDEGKLKALEESLASLETEADNLGVPPDWRK